MQALENFWTLSCQDVHRQIDFHYLTTSSIAMEQDANFGGVKGIEVWRAAQTNPELAIEVARYLVTKLDASSPSTGVPVFCNSQSLSRSVLSNDFTGSLTSQNLM